MRPTAALIPRAGQTRLVYVPHEHTDIRVRLDAAREALRNQPQTRIAVDRRTLEEKTK